MISTDEAAKILEDSGIEVVKKPDPDDIFRDKVFIGTEIIWDKLISGIRSIKELREPLESIPHLKTIQAILNKYNPKLEVINIEVQGMKRQAYGVAFKEIMIKNGRVPRLDKYLGFLFYLMQIYMTPLIEPFEYNDRQSRKGSNN